MRTQHTCVRYASEKYVLRYSAIFIEKTLDIRRAISCFSRVWTKGKNAILYVNYHRSYGVIQNWKYRISAEHSYGDSLMTKEGLKGFSRFVVSIRLRQRQCLLFFYIYEKFVSRLRSHWYRRIQFISYNCKEARLDIWVCMCVFFKYKIPF